MRLPSPNCGLFFPLRSLLLLALTLILGGCQFINLGGKSSSLTPGANSNPCVALALPDSGPYAPFAKKIKSGASMAVEDLKKAGVNVQLHTINTEAPNWIAQIEALPEMCVMVGGPIQEKAYSQAKKSGILEKKAFFTFMPALQNNEEGAIAWRFFPSRQDQINALANFGINDLNIRTYGAFYPNDDYGKKMTDLLEKELSTHQIALEKAAYNPAAPGTWSKAASTLINPQKYSASGQMVPQTAFEALFVPDSWKHMDVVTTSLLYNGEDRLVLMGTTIWEAALSGKPVPKAAKYELAVFPGAWNSEKAPKRLTDAKADFWVALGFDFTNFAAYMGLTKRPESALITTIAQQSASKIRGVAPINWNNAGIASENLYLFQVSSQGMKPLNVDRIRQARAASMERAALRIQGIKDAELNQEAEAAEASAESSMEAQPAAQVETPTPVDTVTPPRVEQPLSTVPQPSYKLRLPARK